MGFNAKINEFEKDVATRANEIRKQKKISVNRVRQQIEDECDVEISESLAYQWFRGERRIPLGLLPSLSRSLRVPITHLLGIQDDSEPTGGQMAELQ